MIFRLSQDRASCVLAKLLELRPQSMLWDLPLTLMILKVFCWWMQAMLLILWTMLLHYRTFISCVHLLSCVCTLPDIVEFAAFGGYDPLYSSSCVAGDFTTKWHLNLIALPPCWGGLGILNPTALSAQEYSTSLTITHILLGLSSVLITFRCQSKFPENLISTFPSSPCTLIHLLVFVFNWIIDHRFLYI